MNEVSPIDRAKRIARETLAGEHDILQACRDLAALRLSLLHLPEDALDAFIAVSSEVDDLPLGAEREHWAPDVLRAQDAEAEEYRERIRPRVYEALRELIEVLDAAG